MILPGRPLLAFGFAVGIAAGFVFAPASRTHAQPPPQTPEQAAALAEQRKATADGSRADDGTARHHGAAAGAERTRGRAESGELRRIEGVRLRDEPAGGAGDEERPQGRERERLVEAAAAGDRRGLRARSDRPRAEERAEGDVVGGGDGGRHARRTRGEGASGRGTRRQLVASGDRRRHPDDARHAGERDRSGAGDDHVPPRRAAAGAWAMLPTPPGPGGPPPPGSDPRRSGTADRRRLGLRVSCSPRAFRRTTAPA